MTSFIITKWIEPYVLLEKAKMTSDMKDYTFDGFNKQSVKQEFMKALQQTNTFGLYMKNVNKFYLFESDNLVDIEKFLSDAINLTQDDFYQSENADEPFDKIDLGKAEAAFIIA